MVIQKLLRDDSPRCFKTDHSITAREKWPSGKCKAKYTKSGQASEVWLKKFVVRRMLPFAEFLAFIGHLVWGVKLASNLTVN